MKKTEVSFEHSNIQWKDTVLPELSNSIDVWKLNTDLDSAVIDQLKKLLNPSELQKASRFYRPEDRKSYIIRQGALHVLLGKYAGIEPSKVNFTHGKNEKPVLDNTKGLHFNVSHSADWILIGVSNTELGVDVERSNPDFTYDEVLSQSFNKAEISSIKNSPNPTREFFSLWTRKESLLKATSKGIDDEFPYVPCMDGIHEVKTSVLESEEKWRVCTFDVEDQYQGSVAFPVDRQPQFFNLQLESLL